MGLLPVQRLTPLKEAAPALTAPAERASLYGPSQDETAWMYGTMRPALTDTGSGLGTSADHSVGVHFRRLPEPKEKDLNALYIGSGVARRAVNLVVDDALGRSRIWQGDKSDNKLMRKAMHKYGVNHAIREAVQQGRSHGTGMIIINTRGSRLRDPLDMSKIGENDLVSLITANQFQVKKIEDEDLTYNPLHPSYGQPEIVYFLYNPVELEEKLLPVHISRIVRFDGQNSLPGLGRGLARKTWGESIFVTIAESIIQQAITSSSVAHLMQESSIPFVKSEGWRNVQRRGGRGDQKGPLQAALDFVMSKSIFRTWFLSKGDEIGRVEVTWGGMAQIFDKQFLVVAAVSGYPATHFWNQSPAGQNATGESDLRFYDMFVDDLRSEEIAPKIEVLDEVVARSAGLPEAPEYEWPPILELSPQDKAETATKYSVAAEKWTKSGVMSRQEIREKQKRDRVTPDITPENLPDINDIPPQLGSSGMGGENENTAN